MSALFILRYAGAGVHFADELIRFTDDGQATRFTAEADAWHAAYTNDLNPARCTVVPLAQIEQPRNQATK